MPLDARPFAWLEDRGPPLALHGAIDDATGTGLALTFRPAQDLHGYGVLLHTLCTIDGLPLALYGDRVGGVVRNDPHWPLEEELRGTHDPTHFGRILQALGIGDIAAHSPQAKGRIERVWHTLQDRLGSELRVRGIRTSEAAHAFLPACLADLNPRFARAPAEAAAAWRRAPRDLAAVRSGRSTRPVAQDKTVRLGPRWVPRPRPRAYAGRRVELREGLDGRLFGGTDDPCVAAQPGPAADFVLRPRHSPSADRSQRLRASQSLGAEGDRSPPPSRKPPSPPRTPRTRSAAAARRAPRTRGATPPPTHPEPGGDMFTEQ